MGVYLNPGNVLFQESLNSEIYVDKTELIQYTNRFINTENKLFCVSRPRRFGKSMALKMLAAYYSKGCDSREMFQGLKVGQGDTEKEREAFQKHLNHYDVLLLDIQDILGRILQEDLTQEELEEFSRKLPGMGETEINTIRHPLLMSLQREIIQDIRENQNYREYIAESENFLGNVLLSIYKNTGNQFILLIDECDSIFRNYENDTLL